jgi:transposase-like protein
MAKRKNPRTHSAEFKLNVVLETDAKGNFSDTAARYGIHITQINNWKRQLLTRGKETFGLLKSSYYFGVKAIEKNEVSDQAMWDKIVKIWETFPGIGYRKLCPILGYGSGKVLRILRKFRQGKASVLRTKNTVTRRIPNIIKKITQDLLTHPEKQMRQNWVLREGKHPYRHIIDPTHPYQRWSGDWKALKITLLGVTLYIFVVIDCYTRQLMGWELSIIKDTQSALNVAQQAIQLAQQHPLFQPRKLIMHTDQGSAYVSDDYIDYWRQSGVILSTADRGKPTQNPYIEAFFLY